MSNIIAWITRTIIFGSVIMYGSLGETITEKVGNLNLGIPGIMCIGGATGFAATFSYEMHAANPSGFLIIVIALISSFLGAALAGLLYAFFTTTLRVNQNITGLTMTIFGVGFAKFLGNFFIPTGSTSTKAVLANQIFSAKIPGLSTLGDFGEMFFSYGFMMYLVIILVVVTHLFMNKTRVGLNLRAIGENPATADAAGINVTLYKYLAICIGSGISGLGGLYYVIDYNYGTWATAAGDQIESLAWLSVALVIFATWKPLNLIWGSYLFGLCFWAYNYVPTVLNIQVNSQLAQILPYVVTIIVLIIGSVRKRKEDQGPASLGLSYFREDR